MLSLKDKLGKGPVVLLGNFDGVHLGHTALVEKANGLRRSSGGLVVAWTFEGIPSKKALLPPELRALWLLELGADLVVLDSFERVRDMSGEEFVRTVLHDTLGASCCVCGYNYRFGKGGAHTAAELALLTKSVGIDCFIVDEVKAELDGSTVSLSSTLLRSLAADGRVEDIYSLSGHFYSTFGEVVQGRGVGKTLGVPTLNQRPDPSCLTLKRGVYATFCRIGDSYYPSVTNIGLCPTFDDVQSPVIETHIIGYEGELYGKTVPVGYISRLRDEKKFPSGKALRDEIEKNIKEATELFDSVREISRLPKPDMLSRCIFMPKG